MRNPKMNPRKKRRSGEDSSVRSRQVVTRVGSQSPGSATAMCIGGPLAEEVHNTGPSLIDGTEVGAEVESAQIA